MLRMRDTRRNKYNAQKVKGWTSGKLYDSKAERDRAEYLKADETAGKIAAFAEQPKVNLTKFHTYKPDYVYLEAGRLVFEDCKGVIGDRFRINMKLWRERGPGVLRISKRPGVGGKWQFRDIHPESIEPAMWDGYADFLDQWRK